MTKIKYTHGLKTNTQPDNQVKSLLNIFFMKHYLSET